MTDQRMEKMASKGQAAIFGEDIYVLTPTGENELRGSETSVSPPELELLVHIDGLSSVAEIKTRIPSQTEIAVIATFRKLLRQDLIKLSDKINSLDFVEYFNSNTTDPSPGAVSAARAEAPDGTSALRKHGYYVRIARRAAGARKLAKDQAHSIVVIEDEPHLVKFLKQYLTLEGFNTRFATNRAEIISELCREPRPDLVLLDVMLPDADGFDVLLKMRGHPVLKTVPVIMLTAKATREAVLKGLTGGADGYITKPFEAEVLLKAVHAVLGLTPA